MKYLVLKSLKERKLHGYAICNSCYELTNKMWKPSFGSLYPVLSNLEKKGFIKKYKKNSKKGERSVKLYSITKKGKNELKKIEENINSLGQILKVNRSLVENPLDFLSRIGISKEIKEFKSIFLKLYLLSTKNKLKPCQKNKIKEALRNLNEQLLAIVGS
ncbi:MAG: PadR family transcriptional regulator [Candidatus Diapherotrites archaeon]